MQISETNTYETQIEVHSYKYMCIVNILIFVLLDFILIIKAILFNKIHYTDTGIYQNKLGFDFSFFPIIYSFTFDQGDHLLKCVFDGTGNPYPFGPPICHYIFCTKGYLKLNIILLSLKASLVLCVPCLPLLKLKRRISYPVTVYFYKSHTISSRKTFLSL